MTQYCRCRTVHETLFQLHKLTIHQGVEFALTKKHELKQKSLQANVQNNFLFTLDQSHCSKEMHKSPIFWPFSLTNCFNNYLGVDPSSDVYFKP